MGQRRGSASDPLLMCIATSGPAQPEASRRLGVSGMQPHMEAGSHFWLPRPAKWADYTAKCVVRGGIEPPAFRFSGGFERPDRSITGCLARPDVALAGVSVLAQPHVSRAVVSKMLARSSDLTNALVAARLGLLENKVSAPAS